MKYILPVLLAYAFGSVPFGKIVAWTHHVDIQKRGSGNIGFANVKRVLGWRAGIVTLASDVLKGCLPTAIALLTTTPAIAFWVGIVAILGHIYPVWLRFLGGKGIATGGGVVLVINPWLGMFAAVLYAFGYWKYKQSASGSLLAALGVVTAGCLFLPAFGVQFAALFTIALWTHRHYFLGNVPDHG